MDADCLPYHLFSSPINDIPLPEQFTYPFLYTPHPLVKIAAHETQVYLQSRTDWSDELQKGKMFGVLIISASNGDIGFLAAFSGNLAGSNRHSFFVPPVYDLLQPDGFFRKEERMISDINRRITEMLESEAYKTSRQALQDAETFFQEHIGLLKEELRKAKENRAKLREKQPTEAEQETMIRESQFQKAEFKRTEKQLKSALSLQQEKVKCFEKQIDELKHERKQRSAALQEKLFKQFRMLNARGETKDLCELFKDTPQGMPPAGAGECALPKMLQYAYLNGLKPLAMGEFWWGMSPKNEIRHHGRFYPSCTGKCKPILKHMLEGLDVAPNPLEKNRHTNTPLEIVYEDEWLIIVNKPAGMLSVPGKNSGDSVYDRLRKMYPDITGPIIVHRLDMDTSGLLLAAKTPEIHKALQEQFEKRTIKKRYTAVLSGTIQAEEGTIDLPLCPDLSNRPQQIVDHKHGKPAITHYKVTGRKNGKTRISFYPQTGRTHQLRVHSAHSNGLGIPILGDPLYGIPAERLHLHAAELEFTHPVTGERMKICKEAPF